jgi:hypothetical protein
VSGLIEGKGRGVKERAKTRHWQFAAFSAI